MKKLIFSLTLATGLLLNATQATHTMNTLTSDKAEAFYSTESDTFVKLITKGDFDSVKSMIIAGTDVNSKANGMTPLMYAARHNKATIAKLLIVHGAKLKVKSDRGYTALEYAKMHKAFDSHKVITDALAAQKLEKKKKKKSKRDA